jgi:hypothetical protein
MLRHEDMVWVRHNKIHIVWDCADEILCLQARECMLNSEAFTRLGLNQHNLKRPSRQVRPGIL